MSHPIELYGGPCDGMLLMISDLDMGLELPAIGGSWVNEKGEQVGPAFKRYVYKKRPETEHLRVTPFDYEGEIEP